MKHQPLAKRANALAVRLESRERGMPTMTAEEAAALYERSLSESFVPRGDGSPRILATHAAEEAAEIYRRYVEKD